LRAQDGLTALIAAAQNGHTGVVELLLDNKADTNAATKVRHARRCPIFQHIIVT
jgi:ankyrin repeat protein